MDTCFIVPSKEAFIKTLGNINISNTNQKNVDQRCAQCSLCFCICSVCACQACGLCGQCTCTGRCGHTEEENISFFVRPELILPMSI
ncbi:MAG: hypothetical protein FP831_07940 [Anaerolineae bacterium]|nr:hypothetical protein [Anaerolineae bacterium]